MKYLVVAALCVAFSGAFAQMQINKPIQLSGSGADARIEGVQDVSANDHAANKIYVDTAIANRAGGSTCMRGTPGPAGGVIVYCGGKDDGNPYFLEAMPTDQSAAAVWGCSGTLVGGTGSRPGTGAANTAAIEAACATPGTAADICANLSFGGFSDWFLPSRDELSILYGALGIAGGYAQSAWYASSTEDNSTQIWKQHFASGDHGSDDKASAYRVRCIRTF